LGSAISQRDLGRFRSVSSAERAFGRSQTLKGNVCASPRNPAVLTRPFRSAAVNT
jgi:hypothetical protein